MEDILSDNKFKIADDIFLRYIVTKNGSRIKNVKTLTISNSSARVEIKFEVTQEQLQELLKTLEHEYIVATGISVKNNTHEIKTPLGGLTLISLFYKSGDSLLVKQRIATNDSTIEFTNNPFNTECLNRLCAFLEENKK